MTARKKADRDPRAWLIKQAMDELEKQMDPGDVLTDVVVVARVVDFDNGATGIVHASNTNWIMTGGMLEAARDLWHSVLPWKESRD